MPVHVLNRAKHVHHVEQSEPITTGMGEAERTTRRNIVYTANQRQRRGDDNARLGRSDTDAQAY